MLLCEQRCVIITGAGSGLGRSYALAFAAEGAQVLVNDIRTQRVASLSDVFAKSGSDLKAAGWCQSHSMSGRSTKGTRSSREWRMLITSLSRSSTSAM